MKKYLVDNTWSLLVLATTAVVVYLFWDRLPAEVPTRYDLAGNPAVFAPKSWALLWLLGAAALYLAAMPLLFKFSPRGYRLQGSGDDVARINLAVVALLCGVELTLISSAGGRLIYPITWGISVSLGLFLLLLGNSIGRLGRNYFIGIRVPWTLRSDRNWKHTHRFAGRVFIVTGALIQLGAFLGAPMAAVLALVLIAALTPVVYSWNFFRREAGRTETTPPPP